jgi:hypothetical protein
MPPRRPDCSSEGERLRRDGYRTVVMCNFTEAMLRNAIQGSGIGLVDAAKRLGSAVEELGEQPDHVAPGLAALADFLMARR